MRWWMQFLLLAVAGMLSVIAVAMEQARVGAGAARGMIVASGGFICLAGIIVLARVAARFTAVITPGPVRCGQCGYQIAADGQRHGLRCPECGSGELSIRVVDNRDGSIAPLWLCLVWPIGLLVTGISVVNFGVRMLLK